MKVMLILPFSRFVLKDKLGNLRPRFIFEQLKRKNFFFFITRKVFQGVLEYVGVKE